MKRCGKFLTVVASLCCIATSGETGETCREFFDRGDPRLFEFVETRETVDFSEYQGLRIGHIDYAVLPVFNENNPDEDNWLYRSINWLHIETRHSTIEKDMIIDEGEVLKKRTIRENERLLRENDYFTDAMILPKSVCGDTINLLVVARDIWTLTPSASASRTGGESRSSVGISDKNFLGTGHEIAVGRSRDADRSGYSIAYRSAPLTDNRFNLELGYEDNSDGEVKEASLIRPFFSFNSRWSAGVSAHDETLEEDIESGGETINTFRRDIEIYQAFYGWSKGLVDGTVNRWTLGVTDEKETFTSLTADNTAPPDDRRLVFPSLSWEYIEDQYLTTANISTIYRLEDILIGTRWNARLGYAADDFGSTENAAIFNITNRYTTSFGEHHLLQVGGEANGRLNTDNDTLQNTVLTATATYHNFIDIKNRWFLQLQLDAARNIDQDEQLTSGGDFLRGYPDDFQRGNRRWVLTAERRRFSNWHPFNLIRVGAAAYVDVGRTWDTETPGAESTSTLANIGFGLRLTSSKARKDKVLHADIAVPITKRDEVDSYQLILTGEAEF